MLIRELQIRIITEETGELICAFTLDPTRNYQAQQAKGVNYVQRQVRTMSRDITECPRGDLNPHAR